MVEGQGFEPWVGYKPTLVFKTSTFNRSVTLPSCVLAVCETPHTIFSEPKPVRF